VCGCGSFWPQALIGCFNPESMKERYHRRKCIVVFYRALLRVDKHSRDKLTAAPQQSSAAGAGVTDWCGLLVDSVKTSVPARSNIFVLAPAVGKRY
jgi:hypothetical protein